MFIYNFKINGGIVLKLIIVVLSIFMLIVFGISVYRIFFTSDKFQVNDTILAKEINEIRADNYTNILQAVHEDLDSYIGVKIKFSGYIYRLIDFKEDEFVLGRDMLINQEQTQSVVVGFLCQYKDIKNFEDGTWVDIIGVIEKGKYHNEEIPLINILEIEETNKPADAFVNPPSNAYVPTSGIL